MVTDNLNKNVMFELPEEWPPLITRQTVSVQKDVAVDSTNYQKLPTNAELRFKGRFLCRVLFMYEVPG